MVAWIAARKDLLALVYSVAAAFFFTKAAAEKRASLFYLALLAFILALLSKGSTVALPVVAILAIVLRTPSLQTRHAKIVAGIALLAASGMSIFQAWFYTNVNDMRHLQPFFERFSSSMIGLARMCLGWVFPSINILDQDNFGEWNSLYANFIPLGICVLLLFLFLVYWLWRKRQKSTLFALFTALILWLPISGLLFPHVNFYSARYAEPLSLALFFGLAVQGDRLWKKRKLQAKVWLFLPFLLPVILLYFTAEEASLWSSQLTVREKAVHFSPNSISLNSYLLGDLINVRKPTPEQAALREHLGKAIFAKCVELSRINPLPQEFANCHVVFQYSYWLRKNAGDSIAAENSLRLFQRSRSMLNPMPAIAGRLQMESMLSSPAADPTLAKEWLEKTPYSILPQYRLLKVASLCLLGSDAAKKNRIDWEREKLLTPALEAKFIESVNPNTQKILKPCF
jgi:hypothetical protein